MKIKAVCRVPHTFAIVECVGDGWSVGRNLEARDCSFPLIPQTGMSGGTLQFPTRAPDRRRQTAGPSAPFGRSATSLLSGYTSINECR